MNELRKTCPKCGLVLTFDLSVLADPLGPTLQPIWGKCPNCGDTNTFAPCRIQTVPDEETQLKQGAAHEDGTKEI